VAFRFHGEPPFVERFHRTLKAAIMCHANQHWTEALPLFILGILVAFKADLLVSVDELVYGEPLRIPDGVLTPTSDPVEPSHLISQNMARIRPVPAARHTSPATFMQNDLLKCTQVISGRKELDGL
jgi:cleavage and polyadenylation specificity factor subunit 1